MCWDATIKSTANFEERLVENHFTWRYDLDSRGSKVECVHHADVENSQSWWHCRHLRRSATYALWRESHLVRSTPESTLIICIRSNKSVLPVRWCVLVHVGNRTIFSHIMVSWGVTFSRRTFKYNAPQHTNGNGGDFIRNKGEEILAMKLRRITDSSSLENVTELSDSTKRSATWS